MADDLELDDVVLGAIRDALATDQELAAAAASGVWQGIAAPNTQPPYVLVTAAETLDRYTFNGVEFATMLVEVRGVVAHRGGNVPAAASKIASGIRRVLDAGITPTGVRIGDLRRVSRLSVEDTVDGVTYYHRGGVYRVAFTPST